MTREEIEAMSHDERNARLTEMASDLFSMANAFAMDKVSGAGVYLHESVNCIKTAQEIIGGTRDSKIPLRVVQRSMGIEEKLIDPTDTAALMTEVLSEHMAE